MNMGTIYVYSLTSFLILLVNGDGPQISIEQGEIIGRQQTTLNNRKFYSFTGIPYAKPPIDSYRFQAPQEFGKWDGVFNATGSHAMCLQLQKSKIVGDEDCLFLNIYTPQMTDAKLLPVMFYIHGGGFYEGSARSEAHGPLYLMEKDVVLVVANYRLGPLGFFSACLDGVSGNNGLKDQAFALKWVKRNIAKFGGDSNRVTVFGHSAGGAMANLHMFSPLSKGTFHSVIAQSGCAFDRWALIPSKVLREHSVALAGIVGCNAKSGNEIVKCLLDVKGTDLIKATETLAEQRRSHAIYFGPTVEANIPTAFLAKDLSDSYKTGDVADVPYMTGITSEDGAIFAPRVLQAGEYCEGCAEKTFPAIFSYSDAPDGIKMTYTKAILKRYFPNGVVDSSTLKQIIKMCTDGLLLNGASKSVQMHFSFSNQSTYYYMYAHRGSTTHAKLYKMESHDFGVTHADELLHLFSGIFPDHVPNEGDNKVTNLLTTLWTNFAIYRNPTPNLDHSNHLQWKPVQKGREYYYNIQQDGAVECKEGLLTEDVKFWWRLFDPQHGMKISDEL